MEFIERDVRDFPGGSSKSRRIPDGKWDGVIDSISGGGAVVLTVPGSTTGRNLQMRASAALKRRGVRVTTRLTDEGVWIREATDLIIDVRDGIE